MSALLTSGEVVGDLDFRSGLLLALLDLVLLWLVVLSEIYEKPVSMGHSRS